MTNRQPSYHGFRFPSQIISHAVWRYHRFCLSFREVEVLLAERGVRVACESIRQWCLQFGHECARMLKRRRGRLGITPSHTTAGTSHAPLQVGRSSATISDRSWRCAESVSGWPSPNESFSPSALSSTSLCRMAAGDVRPLRVQTEFAQHQTIPFSTT